MKYAIILANAAALVCALPQGAPSTPPPPSGSAVAKKPWVKGDQYDCYYLLQPEESCVGTDTWCNDPDLRITERFESAEACLAAREPKPSSTPVPPQQPEPSTGAAQPPVPAAEGANRSQDPRVRQEELCKTINRQDCNSQAAQCASEEMQKPQKKDFEEAWASVEQCVKSFYGV